MMDSANFRFYAELKEFLKRSPDGQTVVNIAGHETVKHLIEMQGIPHTEVDLILANGQSVGFDYLVRMGDLISVYPVFETLNIQAVSQVRPRPLRKSKFILDVHLGRLAELLRLLGLDCLYSTSYQDAELAEVSSQQERILLSRDRGVLKRKIVTRGYLVRSEHPRAQAAEVIQRFDLQDQIQPFSRCASCNGLLKDVDKARIEDQLEPLTRRYYHKFRQCLDCGQIYWRGSHFQHLENMLQEILGEQLVLK